MGEELDDYHQFLLPDVHVLLLVDPVVLNVVQWQRRGTFRSNPETTRPVLAYWAEWVSRVLLELAIKMSQSSRIIRPELEFFASKASVTKYLRPFFNQENAGKM